ncbi:MAG TPA: hypothetical protein PLU04_13920, partial [Anaerolineaceae bacterium]|nr:hypothetical protein [Anaerolineaceae bacterium]HQF46879.1 hypothetical protein [Anaerolineaceae bacterium]
AVPCSTSPGGCLSPGVRRGAAAIPSLSLRGAAEAIRYFSKEGLPRPLRGLAMTDGYGWAVFMVPFPREPLNEYERHH